MDKTTRNAIERATQQSRKLLDEDFSSQLEGAFDVLRSGVIGAKAGAHLSAVQQSQRDKIVAAIEHKRAAGMTAVEAVKDYVRDAAFTTLNRFVALKMLEARELVQECITKGEQSAGYREFCGMAPGVALLPDSAGYRLYIESLFDEFSTEIKVLFDRRDAASVLWPKRQTFEALLAILNAPDLLGIWGEDETLGWIYQYFNSLEERQAMKDVKAGGSQSPRNSRELAARNQFFTPRYVVQFLTDNTLGRLWCEMRSGHTSLAENCTHLVRLPDQLQQRVKKDPRDLRVLDPACGSGHFLLYAFDLLITVYEEAWADASSPPSEVTGKRLSDDYPSLDTLHRELPQLVLRHNLYGIDIDSRCVQIAQLALWMRAQKAFRDFKIARFDRPAIQRSNLVTAEPMPGEADLQSEFIEKLGDQSLARAFEAVVNDMKLAGDLGLLLRFEQFLVTARPASATYDLFAQSGGKVRDVLKRFVDEAETAQQIRRRLFSEDAAQGIGLLELLENEFDVILMNPPFGESSVPAVSHLQSHYSKSWKDLFRAFVERAVELSPHGLVGALGPRTSLFLPHGQEWRRECLIDRSQLTILADLGIGVLDSAKIEVAAYVVSRSTKPALFLRALKTYDKAGALERLTQCQTQDFQKRLIFLSDVSNFKQLPSTAFAYWVSTAFIELFTQRPPTEGTLGDARVGLQTSDDFRFIRLRWEVRPGACGTWRHLAKGGEYSPFFSDIHLVVRWANEGEEVCQFNEERYGSASRNVRSKDRYFEPGVTWSPRTTTEFAPRVLPRSCIFGQKGPSVLVRDPTQGAWALSVMNSRVYQYLLTVGAGAADIDPGSISKSYGVGLIQSTPVPNHISSSAAPLALSCWEMRRSLSSRFDLTSAYFVGIPAPGTKQSVDEWLSSMCVEICETECNLLESWDRLSSEVLRAYGLSEDHVRELDAEIGTLWKPSLFETLAQEENANEDEEPVGRLAPRGWGYVRRNARERGRSPREVLDDLRADLARRKDLQQPFATEVLDFYFGWALGVFKRIDHENWATGFDGMFAELPLQPPALCSARDSFLVDDPGHPADIEARLLVIAEQDWGERARDALESLVAFAGLSSNVRDYFARSYFGDHIRRFSRSRRNAPIFWQIATLSARYSVWLHAHALTSDTLYQIQNEYVVPKLAHEERQLTALIESAGATPTARERKDITAQQALVEELRTMLDEIKRVASLWKPTLDDGMLLTMAPLWRLVPQNKPWQKELQSKWEELIAGKHDWAHLAMHLWPERVIPKCGTDRSLAMAHGLDGVFWAEDANGKWKSKPTPSRTVDELIRERSSPAVKSALKILLESPDSAPTSRRRRRDTEEGPLS
jgi:hypothetical protein